GRHVGRQLDGSRRRFRQPLTQVARDFRTFLRMAWRMGTVNAAVRRHWWRTMLDCLFHNPRALRAVGAMAALYLHMGPFARYVVSGLNRKIAAITNGNWHEPSRHITEVRTSVAESLNNPS